MKSAVGTKNSQICSRAGEGTAVSSIAAFMISSHRSRAAASTGKGGVAHTQPRVSALFDVFLRAAKAKDKKIAHALLGPVPVVLWVHGPDEIVLAHAAVKSGDEICNTALAELIDDFHRSNRIGMAGSANAKAAWMFTINFEKRGSLLDWHRLCFVT